MIYKVESLLIETPSVTLTVVLEACEKQSYNKFTNWIENIVFILKDEEKDIISHVMGVEILLETELIGNISHWPTATTNYCQECKEDGTLHKDLSSINWHDLNNIAPADVVCHF